MTMKPLVLALVCAAASAAGAASAIAPVGAAGAVGSATAPVGASGSAASAVGPQSAPQAVINSAADTKERTRLEELFIWRTSEELRLAPNEELKFTDAIHALNKRRRAANVKMDEALRVLAAAKSRAEAEKALASHRAALRELQAVANSELDKLKPLLGPQKIAQYLVVKSTILEKLKEMLATPAQTQAASKPAVSAGSSVATPASGTRAPQAMSAAAATDAAARNAASAAGAANAAAGAARAPQAAKAAGAKPTKTEALQAAAAAAGATASSGIAAPAAQAHAHAAGVGGTASGTTIAPANQQK